MLLLQNKITLSICLLVTGIFLSLNFSCTEKIAGSEVTNEDAVCLVGKVLDQRGQGVSNIIARLDKIHLADTTDNNGNYSLKLSKQEITDLKINLDTLNDTVKIISSGNIESRIGITKWIDTLPSVYLIQRNIYGKLETDGTILKRIEAIITVLDTNNNVIEKFSKELWFNTGTSGFSGFCYFPKNTRNLKYSVYVRVFNKDSIYSGKSQTIYFNDIAGDIEIPSFNFNFNPELQVIAGKDTMVSINDTIRLHLIATDSFGGKIIKCEWSINGAAFIQTSKGDTSVIAPADSNPHFKCVVRVSDDANKISKDSLKIIVCKDVPTVYAGNDTTVSINDTIRLHTTETDRFGMITKWEWSINGGAFVQTSKGDTSIIAPTDSNPYFKCIVRVTDDDGQTNKDSLKIIVCKDVPTIYAGNDTTVIINDTIRLHPSITNRFGRVSKWEWDIGNTATFTQTSTGDTNIVAPSLSQANYRCILRITDDDGLVAQDTVRILVLGYVKDIDGNTYYSIKFANQEWTVNNFRSTKYNDGTPIPKVEDSVAWVNLTTPGYCYYNNTNDTSEIKYYGGLYNWYAVDPANPKKIAPAGWHVPTDTECDILKKYLNETILSGQDTHFNLVNGGFRLPDSRFIRIDRWGVKYDYWWATKDYEPYQFTYFEPNLFGTSSGVSKSNGFSLRLIKD